MKVSFLNRMQSVLRTRRAMVRAAVLATGAVAMAMGASTVQAAPTIYVSFNSSSNAIQKVDSSGTVTTPTITGSTPGNVYGLTSDGVSNLYASNGYGFNIDKINVSTNVAAQFNTTGGMQYAADLARDGAGNVYVANNNGNNVLKYDSTGAGSVFNSTLTGADAVTVSTSGQVYVLNGGTDIYKLDSSGVATSFVTGLSGARGLAFDSSGNLFTLNYNAGAIVKIDSTGAKSNVARTGTDVYNNPKDLIFDADDNLYIANSSPNNIAKFVFNTTTQAYDGTVYATLSAGPTGIALVPEPSSVALLGLGGLALLRRRRGVIGESA